MINMIEGGGWFGDDTRVFYKKFEGYYQKNQKKGWDDFGARTFSDSVSKTKSFRLNQKKGWDDFGARTFADSVSKTKSFRLNQKKGWMRLKIVFLFLEEIVWGRTGLGFVSKK